MAIALSIAFVVVHALAVSAGIGALRGDAQGMRVFGCFGILSALTLCGLVAIVHKETILYLALAATVLGVLGGLALRSRGDS